MLHAGHEFVLDRDSAPGDANRVELPHREIFAALEPGARLLLDDGKLVLRVLSHSADRIDRDGRGRRGAFEQQGAQRARRGACRWRR